MTPSATPAAIDRDLGENVINASRMFEAAAIRNDVARLLKEIDAIESCTAERRERIKQHLASIERDAVREVQMPSDCFGG